MKEGDGEGGMREGVGREGCRKGKEMGAGGNAERSKLVQYASNYDIQSLTMRTVLG